ncbi:MAG TPA: hypothetical protein VEK35_02180 [Roseiarcus sp.]|nr:hypothetical protein [Roseiarcus sp.]
MLRFTLVVAVAATACSALAENAQAALIAPLQTGVAAGAPDVIPVYYYHGRYYPYRWNGRYYGHRYYRHGRYYYS